MCSNVALYSTVMTVSLFVCLFKTVTLQRSFTHSSRFPEQQTKFNNSQFPLDIRYSRYPITYVTTIDLHYMDWIGHHAIRRAQMRGVEQWRRVSVKRVNWHFLCSVCALHFNGCGATWIYIRIRIILKRYKLLFQNKKNTLRLLFSKFGVFVFSLFYDYFILLWFNPLYK